MAASSPGGTRVFFTHKGLIAMGQYYIPMILEDRAPDATSAERPRFAFYSHDFGNGLKLMEHSWRRNDFVAVVAAFLAAMPGRLVWAGDYADDEPGMGEGVNLYTMVSGPMTRPVVRINGEDAMARTGWDERGARYGLDEVNVEATVDLEVAEGLRFFVNLDRGEYVDIHAAPDEGADGSTDWAGWQIHPLPLLTAEGNGRGGGDYRGDEGADLIGAWARQRITARADRPTGLTEITPGFTEQRSAVTERMQ